MDAILAFVTSMTTGAPIVAVVTTLIGSLYKFSIKPMQDKVERLPDSEQIREIVGSLVTEKINVILIRIKTLEDKISTIDDFENVNSVHVKDIQRDIESVKTILNQFQGHMMYGRRSSDFGNQELK